MVRGAEVEERADAGLRREALSGVDLLRRQPLGRADRHDGGRRASGALLARVRAGEDAGRVAKGTPNPRRQHEGLGSGVADGRGPAVDDETDRKMRQVLVQLELTSNGGTLNYEGSSSGGHDQPVPSLGQHDAPHLHYADLYRRALSPPGRALVLQMAADELDRIRRSRGDPSREETRDERDARIIANGEGYSVDEVAVWARCSKQAVRVARRDAGREEETGKKPINGHELGAGLVDEIRRRVDRGTPARQVAKALSLSYSTVLRALGRKA